MKRLDVEMLPITKVKRKTQSDETNDTNSFFWLEISPCNINLGTPGYYVH